MTYELTGSYQLLPAYSSSGSFLPLSHGHLASDATVLRGRCCRSDVYISQEESLSIRCFTVLARRLGQSDPTACSLYIIRTAYGSTVILLCLITVNHISWRKSNLQGVFYLHGADDLCSLHLIVTTSKCKHLLVEISVQRVQLTNIILLNSKGSHHLWLSCMKCVVCSETKPSRLRHKYMHSITVNCEYHNS